MSPLPKALAGRSPPPAMEVGGAAGACGAGHRHMSPLPEAYAGRSPQPAMEVGGAGKPGEAAFVKRGSRGRRPLLVAVGVIGLRAHKEKEGIFERESKVVGPFSNGGGSVGSALSGQRSIMPTQGGESAETACSCQRQPSHTSWPPYGKM
ncbi:unnamed protein product [Boreogadus saida]